MAINKFVREWQSCAEMDYKAALHLYEHMYPQPYEIICYHCQQAVEKLLKGLMASKGEKIEKTHDLGLLAELLSKHIEIDETLLDMCDDLTPYGVNIRYPQEVVIEQYHVDKALTQTKILYEWLNSLF